MESLRTSLSIIMPVFNHRDEVRTMIDSILANDFNAWELLAVDDGSGEDTLQMLESYAAADNRIRVVRRSRQPKGAQTCRNIGLEMARGEFVIVFDSDDYIAPYCLRQRVKMLQKRPDLDFLVFPSGVFVDERFVTESHSAWLRTMWRCSPVADCRSSSGTISTAPSRCAATTSRGMSTCCPCRTPTLTYQPSLPDCATTMQRLRKTTATASSLRLLSQRR